MDTFKYQSMLTRNAMPARPQFSIIIACKNPGPQLARAAESVWDQTDTSNELVVVDGASTDGTRDWLETHGARLGGFLSEPDRGVYEAMNKGARLAHGEWLLFLGADDRLASTNTLAEVHQIAAAIPEARWLCGSASYADGRVWPAPVRPNVRYRNFLHHQAAFYHRSLFERFQYDETLRIQADYDLNLRLWCAGIRPVPLPVRVAICSAGGLSDGGHWANYREEIAVRHRYFPAWRCAVWDAGSVARWLRKRIVRSSPHAQGSFCL